jgi:hypothetical protein
MVGSWPQADIVAGIGGNGFTVLLDTGFHYDVAFG